MSFSSHSSSMFSSSERIFCDFLSPSLSVKWQFFYEIKFSPNCFSLRLKIRKYFFLKKIWWNETHKRIQRCDHFLLIFFLTFLYLLLQFFQEFPMYLHLSTTKVLHLHPQYRLKWKKKYILTNSFPEGLKLNMFYLLCFIYYLCKSEGLCF